MFRNKVFVGLAVFFTVALLATGFGLARWWYGRQLREERIDRINAEARADTLRQVAGGWEQRALLAENQKELAAAVNEEMRNYLERTDRRLRALTNVVAVVEDRLGIDTNALARGDSTEIHWQHADSVIDLRVALAFPGMVRPDPEPAVTGTADIRARVAAQIGLSCDPATGAPFANASVMDRRIAVTALDVTVDEGVSCLPPAPKFGPLDLGLEPNPWWFGAGLGAGYFVWGRR